MAISLSSIWFNYIHSNFLLYNTCWEDSAIDRHLLNFDQGSKILAITSAGCNVLNYLLDKPSSIHCIDINPKQTALLELKTALIAHGDYETFWNFFGEGKSNKYEATYEQVKHLLSSHSQKFWRSNIHSFSPDGKGFFYSGGSGLFAQLINYILKKKGISKTVQRLIHEPNKETREELFASISNKLWDGYEKKFWKTPAVLSLVGVPKVQVSAIEDLNTFMQKALWYVLVEQTPVHNPFWRVYFDGSYSKDCCPEYLKEKNFTVLYDQLDSLEISTGGIDHFLSVTDQKFNRVILLDYMDWLTGDKHHELSKVWQLLLERVLPTSTILFRTAHSNTHFLPDFVKERVDIQQVDQDWVLQNDRVGTYSGTYMCTIR